MSGDEANVLLIGSGGVGTINGGICSGIGRKINCHSGIEVELKRDNLKTA